MHLSRVLRYADVNSIISFYDARVWAIVVKRGKTIQVYSKAGGSSSKVPSIPWKASKHAEIIALEHIPDKHPNCTVVLTRLLPSSHPKAEFKLNDEWSLGSADMCKVCYERLKKKPKAKHINWVTPDRNSESCLRSAIVNEPELPGSYKRMEKYVRRYIE